MTTAVSANRAWLWLLRNVMSEGNSVSPRMGKTGAGVTREILNYSSCVRMERPCVSVLERGLSLQFMAAEAAWILSGDNRVATIAKFAPSISRFSDNGRDFFGAYGPKIHEQIIYVVQALIKDTNTRQAVMTIWRESPPDSKDIPCTVSVQWLIRDRTLHCVDTMRSSDVWLGWPYDVFNFSMLSAMILLMLRDQGFDYDLGSLFLNAGSQHLYDRNLDGARDCVNPKSTRREFVPFNWRKFGSAGGLVAYLQNFSNGIICDPKWIGVYE